MLRIKKFNAVLFVLLLSVLAVFLAACSEADESVVLSTIEPISDDHPVTVPTSHSEPQQEYRIDTYIILNNEDTTINGDGASFNNNVLSITSKGSYFIKGNLNGTIEVKCKKGDVRLFLSGVSVECEKSSALFCSSSKCRLSLTTVENTVNYFLRRAEGDSKEHSAVFSKGNLSVEGDGSLAIICSSGNGISCLRSVTFKSGSTDIQSSGYAVRAHNNLKISGGTLGISSKTTAVFVGGDHSTLSLEGGKTNISGIECCLKSSFDVTVSGGKHELISGGGSTDEITGQSQTIQSNAVSQGDDKITTGPAGNSKAIDANGSILLSGGNIYANSSADAFCASDVIAISGGAHSIRADGTALLSEKTLSISGGETEIDFCGKGIETETLIFSSGKLRISAKHNAAGIEKNMFQSGGTLVALSSDSEISSAVDFGKSCSISGGTLFAAGGTKKLRELDDSATPSVSLKRKLSGGSLLTIVRDNTTILGTLVPFNCNDAVLFSDLLTSKASYKIYAGTATGDESVLVATVTAK